MGAVIIPVDRVVSGKKIEGWFDLEAPTTKVRGKPMKAQVCNASCFTRETEVLKLEHRHSGRYLRACGKLSCSRPAAPRPSCRG